MYILQNFEKWHIKLYEVYKGITLLLNINNPTKVFHNIKHKNHLEINSCKTGHNFFIISQTGKLLWRKKGKKKCSSLKYKVIFHWPRELCKCYLLPFALLICKREYVKCAKLTSHSIKIKTTLAKEEIGQILSFVCKHEEEKIH